jgi:DnaK suppressor protein
MTFKIPTFTGKKKKHYDLLMQIREQITQQFEFHASEALGGNLDSTDKNGMSTHMADLGSDNFLHDMELSMITNEGEILEYIDEAVQRLIDGEYGKCLDCTCKINPERLEAKPYALYCIKCKTIRENNGGINPEQDQ